MRRMPLGLLACVALAADPPPKNVKLPTGKADLNRGQKLFESHCSLCHGNDGSGGRGPVLARPSLKRAPDDRTLLKVVEEGIAGTEMPGAWQMNEREMRQVSAYARSLGRVKPKSVPGDAANGARVYSGKAGCASCHAIAGKGGGMGPDLSAAGLRRSEAYLRESILSPESAVPDDFLQVRVTTAEGRTVTGMRLGEDTFTIQVRDYAGRLHSYWKRDLKQIVKDRGKSPMPSYKDKLTGTELTDLVAYLASLREEK